MCRIYLFKWRAGHLTPNLGDKGNKMMRTSCSNMFGLISAQAVCKCALRYIFVCHVTFCVWPGVSGYIFCAWQCGNNAMLSQHQLIVSKHFIKQKLIAFTSAELTGIPSEAVTALVSRARGWHKGISFKMCKFCQVHRNQNHDQITPHPADLDCIVCSCWF